MAAVDNVKVNTSSGVGGSTYTSSISNDTLTNEDFLKLMVEELKMQDPTKPMDSQRMLDTQMQMSSIETNMKTIEAMDSLKSSIANMTLSNAMDFMGKKVDAIVDQPVYDDFGRVKKDENGNTITEKIKASYLINTVRVDNGEVYLESSELLDIKDRLYDFESQKIVTYDFETGQIKDSDGNYTDYFIKLDDKGRFDMTTTGLVVITDKDGKVVDPEFTPEESTEKQYKYAYMASDEIYSENNTNIQYTDIVKVY